MSKDTGGPAFPHHVVCDKGWAETQKLQGMTLRDYFAAKAMQSLITSPNVRPMITDGEVSVWAYMMADAMLQARKGGV